METSRSKVEIKITKLELTTFGMPEKALLLLLLVFVVVSFATAQSSAQSVQSFQMPRKMYSSHSGEAITDIGLTPKEISDLLKMVVSTVWTTKICGRLLLSEKSSWQAALIWRRCRQGSAPAGG